MRVGSEEVVVDGDHGEGSGDGRRPEHDRPSMEAAGMTGMDHGMGEADTPAPGLVADSMSLFGGVRGWGHVRLFVWSIRFDSRGRYPKGGL